MTLSHSSGSRELKWQNTNELLGCTKSLLGLTVDGVKTGITPVAGGCLALHAVSNDGTNQRNSNGAASNHEFYCFTFKSRSKASRFTDTAKLLTWAEKAHGFVVLKQPIT
jgi:D-alanyl-D-alanine carboxypeptidase